MNAINNAGSAQTLFYGCANLKYQDFVPLHAASILEHVPDVTVEMGIEDEAAYKADYGNTTDIIHAAYGRERFLVRQVDWTILRPGQSSPRRIRPGSVRFITPPQTRTEYVYIGDVDIIVLDPTIVRRHLNFMERTGLPYSNKARSRPQLTGLHFTRYDAYYPLPDLGEINLVLEGDEALLYKIVQLQGHPISREDFRPVPGIHVSPNRPPVGEVRPDGTRGPGWGIERWAEEFAAFSSSNVLQELRPKLSPRIHGVLEAIEDTIKFL